MPSSTTTTTTQRQVAKQQPSTNSITNTKEEKNSRKVLLHQTMSPSPPDDWVLFPQEIIAQKFSSIRHAKPRNQGRPVSAQRQKLPLPDSHVIEPRATTPSRSDGRETPKPYRPSYCLHHMSARNCTPACHDVNFHPETQKPPKAPSPPRLPTPDLPDFGEDDLWSCCRSSESHASDRDAQCGDDFWNEMSMDVVLAPDRLRN